MRLAVVVLLACHCSEKRAESDTAVHHETGRADSSPMESGDTGSGNTGAPDTVDSTGGETGDSGSDIPPCDSGEDLFADRDGDGYGDWASPVDCHDPHAVADATDCDDGHSTVHPGALELGSSGRDDDCDGLATASGVLDVAHWEGTVEPEHLGDWWHFFGQSLALPGDLTGDGAGDLVVLAASYNDLQGAAIVFRGPFAPAEGISYSADAASIVLGASDDRGRYVSRVGDVNGDGMADLLMSTMGDGSQYRVYLIPGPIPAGTTTLDDTAQSWTDLTVNSALETIAGPGDVNEDGLDDILLGAPYADESGGRAYLVLGPGTVALSEADATYLAGDGDVQIGGSFVTGDLDGDGTSDFVIGGKYQAHMILDAEPGTFVATDVGVTVTEDYDVSWYDFRPTEVGDVNGDGYTDLGIAEPQGGILVVLNGPFGDEDTVSAADWNTLFYSNNGGVGQTELSSAVSLGDWDNDGWQDFAVVNLQYIEAESRENHDCWSYGWNWCSEGSVFLAAGPFADDGGWYDLDQVADRIDGDRYGAYEDFGRAIGGGEDLDGDGFPDLAVTDMANQTAFIIFGGATW